MRKLLREDEIGHIYVYIICMMLGNYYTLSSVDKSRNQPAVLPLPSRFLVILRHREAFRGDGEQ